MLWLVLLLQVYVAIVRSPLSDHLQVLLRRVKRLPEAAEAAGAASASICMSAPAAESPPMVRGPKRLSDLARDIYDLRMAEEEETSSVLASVVMGDSET